MRPVLLVGLLVGCAPPPVLTPPTPLGAPTHVDGTRGVAGYVGVRSGLLQVAGVDMGMRAQVHDHFAVDVMTAWDLSYSVGSLGLWVSTAPRGETNRHAVAWRFGPSIAVGDVFSRTRYLGVSVGMDTRLQYTWRWAPRGALYFTFQYSHLGFVNVVGDVRPTHTPGLSSGVDIPAGPISVVFQFGTYWTVYRSGDATDTVSQFHGSIGVRWGKQASGMSTVKERRAAGE